MESFPLNLYITTSLLQINIVSDLNLVLFQNVSQIFVMFLNLYECDHVLKMIKTFKLHLLSIFTTMLKELYNTDGTHVYSRFGLSCINS